MFLSLRTLILLSLCVIAFTQSHHAFADPEAPAPAPAPIPLHLQILNDAEKIVAEKKAQKAVIQKQAQERAQLILQTRTRVQTLPNDLREKTLQGYAARLSEILNQLEQTKETSGIPYREVSPDERAALYQEAISIAETIPHPKWIIKQTAGITARTLLTIMLTYVPYWGITRHDGPVVVIGAVVTIVSAIYNGVFGLDYMNIYSTDFRTTPWNSFWEAMALKHDLPKNRFRRNNWMMERILSAYEPKLRLEIPKTMARIANHIECENLVTNKDYQETLGLQQAVEAEVKETLNVRK